MNINLGKYDSLFWAGLFFLFALIFSVKVPPAIGVIVFVVFFTCGVALVKKFIEEIKAGK